MGSSFYYYLSSSFVYGLLLIASASGFTRLPPFTVAALVSLLWSLLNLLAAFDCDFNLQYILIGETLRNSAWFFLIGVLISRNQFCSNYQLFQQHRYVLPMAVVCLLIASIEVMPGWWVFIDSLALNNPLYAIHVMFAIAGLVLVEQLYRNTPLNRRSNLNALCLALSLIFTIDLLVYSNSLLYNQLDSRLWELRGLINAIAALLLLISRNRMASSDGIICLEPPRKTMFYTTVLFGCGIYLAAMSFTGFFLQQANEEWLQAAQMLFMALAITLLIIPFTSGKIRAITKVYFTKHFFHYSYDYRVEWIKISRALAQFNSLDVLKPFIITTMTELVESSGGGLWIRNHQGQFLLAAEQNLRMTPQELHYLSHSGDVLGNYLLSKQWVIDFNELARAPEVYNDIDLSAWCYEDSQVWLIVPLLRLHNLEAFVILTQARAVRKLNWEDHDMLKTVGMQLANALALTCASEELANHRQFETYNRLAAFLVHDLKNLSAQLSLIVNNVGKHRHNPAFFDDVVDTLGNVISKTQHMVTQLRQGPAYSYSVNLLDLVGIVKSIEQQHRGTPVVEYECNPQQCLIRADRVKLISILSNLIQNGQDAAREVNGTVKVCLDSDQNQAIIQIIDTGIGMDKQFIAERLFKPFDTTKGNAGMGIGAYEAKDYISKIAGRLSVESQPGQGTTFTITLPLADTTHESS